MRHVLPCLAFAASICAGCASIIGLPERSLRFCLQPAQQHDFCEDFDHPNPTADWTAAPDPPPGTSRTFVSSSYSPPNALAMDTAVGPLATDVSNFTGLQQVFTTKSFTHVVLGADVNIQQYGYKTDGEVGTAAGFMLLSSTSSSAGQPSLCIGLALAPNLGATSTSAETVAIVIELVPNSHDCVTLDESLSDAGISLPMALTDEAGAGSGVGADSVGPVLSPVAVVFLRQWFRLTLDVTRHDDGSGTIDFRVSAGTASGAPAIPPGALGQGYPGIGIATDVTGPSDDVEVLFDNITVDLKPE